MIKRLLLTICILFSLTMVSANLEIVGDNNFTVVGDVGEKVNLAFTLKNIGDKVYNNISGVVNEHAKFNKIDNLAPNEVVTVEFEVTVNNRINMEFEIFGTYFEDRGVSDDIYLMDIVNEDEAGIPEELRNIRAYVGDEIVFQNNIGNDWIEIWDIEHDTQIRRIEEGENYTRYLNNEEEIHYVIRRRGVIDLTSPFTLNVLPTTGEVHDPFSDTSIFLNIKPTYAPTVISPTFISTSFSMEFMRTSGNAFVLKNIGNETAKNIQLSGEWIKFSENNFDIEVGQSVSVTFDIDLTTEEKDFFDDTEKTNLTYIKYMRIQGNFPTISQPINIFIQHTEIIDGEAPDNLEKDLEQKMVDLLLSICDDYPDNEFCSNPYYTGGNREEDIISINGTRYSFQELLTTMFDVGDVVEETAQLEEDNREEIRAFFEKYATENDLVIQEVRDELKKIRQTSEISNSVTTGAILSSIMIGLFVMIYKFKGNQDGRKKTLRQFR